MNLAEERIADLLLLIILSGIIIYTQYRAKHGKIPDIRRVPVMERIEEAVGRASEMGGKVHFGMGFSDLSSGGSQTLAVLAIGKFVASQCAKLGASLVVTSISPQMFPVLEQTMKEAYVMEGYSEEFKEDTVRFLSDQQMAYCAGVLGILAREDVRANFYMGGIGGETLIIYGAAHTAGAINIGGATAAPRMPDMMIGADYSIIGEELYAVGAYITRDPEEVGRIFGQDIGKLIVISLMAVGSILWLLGNKTLLNLLMM